MDGNILLPVAESFVQLYFGGQGKRNSFTYCNDTYMVHIRFCAALCSWICLVWPETKFRGKSLLKFVHHGQKFIRGSMNSPSSGTSVCILLGNLTSFMFILESSRLQSALFFFTLCMINMPLQFSRFQSDNKSPQGQVQPQDSNSIANARMDNNSNMDVGKTPSIRNTSELPCGDTVLAGHKATSSSVRVLPGEDLSSGCNLGGQNGQPDDAGDLSLAEGLSSVTISDPELPHTSNANDDSREKLSASSVISATEHSPEEIVSNAQNDSSSLSTKVDTSAEMKLDDLTLDEAGVLAQEEEGIGEDGETFLAKLHDKNEDLSQTGGLVDELSLKSSSEGFDYGKITYNPASWTPMEIAAATGDPERSTVEHALELKSTYSEIEVLWYILPTPLSFHLYFLEKPKLFFKKLWIIFFCFVRVKPTQEMKTENL